VMKVFNLQEEDFDSLKEFHEYQELAETLIFNKMNKYDEAETDRIIVEHEQKNHDKINKNRQRLAIMNREIENDLKHQRLEELKLMTDIERQEMQKRAERELEIEETNRVRLGELTTTTAVRICLQALPLCFDFGFILGEEETFRIREREEEIREPTRARLWPWWYEKHRL